MSYFIATLGRSGVQINFDIWLPTEEEMREKKNPSGKSFCAAILYFLARKTYNWARNGRFSAGKYTQYRTGQYRREQYSTAQQRTAEQCAGERSG